MEIRARRATPPISAQTSISPDWQAALTLDSAVQPAARWAKLIVDAFAGMERPGLVGARSPLRAIARTPRANRHMAPMS